MSRVSAASKSQAYTVASRTMPSAMRAPAGAAVPRPERLSPRAGVERAAIRRVERERLDLKEAGHALAGATPGLPAVRREPHSVVAARREHARLAGSEREGARRHGARGLQKRFPRRAAVVADDDQPARELSRDRGPEPAGHGGIRDERGDVGPGKGRARRERLPRRAGVARAVEVAARRPAVDDAGLERIEGEDADLGAPEREAPPRGGLQSGARENERGGREAGRPGPDVPSLVHDASIVRVRIGPCKGSGTHLSGSEPGSSSESLRLHFEHGIHTRRGLPRRRPGHAVSARHQGAAQGNAAARRPAAHPVRRRGGARRRHRADRDRDGARQERHRGPLRHGASSSRRCWRSAARRTSSARSGTSPS